MREAMPDKLLTLAVTKSRPNISGSTEATGGIEVGQYLDYAWSGYMSESEDIQLLDPWEVIDLTPGDAADLGMMLPTTNHPRRPIAGVPSENFGYFAVPWYPGGKRFPDDGTRFYECGHLGYDGLCAEQYDRMGRPYLQSTKCYESSWNAVPSMLWAVFGR